MLLGHRTSILPLLAALAPPGAALAQIPQGPELQINTYTTGFQYYSSVAKAANGDFVVSWQSFDQDGSSAGIFAQRLTSAGVALATEFQVNTVTANSEARASVAAAAGGAFVIAWQGNVADGNGRGIRARRFSGAGDPLAAELQVNSHTIGDQRYPSVAVDADGDFVVVWQSENQDGSDYGVFGQRFSSTGGPVAAEFQVNTYTTSYQKYPSVAMRAEGDFIVVWHSYLQDGSDHGVFAQRFSSAGDPVAVEFQVNTYTTNLQLFASVAVDGDGDFVVAWQSGSQGPSQDGSLDGIFAQRFASSGATLATEFQVNTYTPDGQRYPRVVADSAGNFTIAWQSRFQDGSSQGVFARRFSGYGVPVATELQVNTYTSEYQQRPALAVDAAGDFVVTWGSYGQDGDAIGIFAQRLSPPAILDIDGNGATGALTDGLLVLRYLFGFTGATLVTGAVDLVGCLRCDAEAIEGYLATLI